MKTETVVLTEELIERCRTDAGGFTGATIVALGMNLSDLRGKKGWTFRLRGTVITRDQYERAVAGRLQFNRRVPPSDHPELSF